MGSSKMLDKAIRKQIKAMPAVPSNPYAALLTPLTIVPDKPESKVLMADAGTIIKLADQQVFYRHRVSPITHRADEILVHYGKAKTPELGWITNRLDAKKAMKPVKGPTFLVTTKKEDSVSVWDRFRFKIGRARQRDAGEWLVPWLVRNGAKDPRELRALVRFLGGKPIKDEGVDARCSKVFSLILNTEIDMATAKASAKKHKKGKNTKAADVPEKKSKKTKKNKASKSSARETDRITSKHDDYIIKRLVKENPRRAGSGKAKIWDKLKKGMTVGEFVAKGGPRGAVRHYVESGWVKLLRPKTGDAD